MHTVIFHVGTNDVVYNEPEEVPSSMAKLINKVTAHTKDIAASCVMKRCDGKVTNNK